MKSAKLDTPSARRQLPARSSPYYNKLRTNLSLGFRKRTASSEGIWTARFGNGSTLPYVTDSLGDLVAYAPDKRFDQAKLQASRWADLLESRLGIDSHSPKAMITVRQACLDWLEQKRLDGRSAKTLRIAELSLIKHVYSHPIADVKLDKITEVMLTAWVKKVRETPATGRKLGKGVEIKLAPGSVNKIIDPLSGSLTFAYERGILLSKKFWDALDRDRSGGKPRDYYLDEKERKALIDNARPDAALFFKSLCLLPFRPGAMASLKVGAFDARRNQLTVGFDKGHKERKLTLHPETAEFFAAMCKDKLPMAPIFSQADGKPWNSQVWWHAMEAAKKAANLPDNITLYALRHSTISDLLQYHKLNIYTVAAYAGTSPEQISKHYFHLLQEVAVEGMGKLNIGLR